MRKISLFLLLASAAVPALAAPGGDDRGRRQRGDDSGEQSESRQERRIESRRSDEGPARVRSEEARESRQGVMEATRERIREQREERAQAASTQATGNDASDRVLRRGSRDSNAGQSSWQPRERRIRTIPDTQAATSRPATIEPPASVTRARRDYRNGDYTRWSTNRWRNDHRYDWRRWRDRHRSLFRLGYYYDPFGWSYRRWSLGSFLWPSYYGSRYWLNDPWHYRLPPAYGPYRWVRYWDDALLVNIYTGQVVDVIHNFFW